MRDTPPPKKRRSPLAFLGKIHSEDWRRAFILAEIVGPPYARRALPRYRVHGLPEGDPRVDEQLRPRPL